jgi:predicted Zn-dependent protease
MARPITKDPEAYQAYMKGRYLWSKNTQEPLTKSIQYLQQAIERDPEFAMAYAGIADAYTDLAVQDYVAQIEGCCLARKPTFS